MPDSPDVGAPIPVAADGLLRGRELAGEAMASLDEGEGDVLRLETPGGSVRLPLAWLDGARYAVGALELFVDSGDVIVLTGSRVGALAAEIERRVLVLPELTRSLRALGSSRASSAEHDRFFAALLGARREAERAHSALARRAAFDAEVLRHALTECLHDLAAERYPSEPPEQRALQAELQDESEPLVVRLTALERAQAVLAASDDAERFARWRAWSSALGAVFESADVCWSALRVVLAPERRGRRSRWRGLGRSRRGPERSGPS